MSVDHSGHRQRLKRALSENGLMSFSPHEVIELMLYSALPRRDVNELAHEISARFGGVNGLMNASFEEMISFGLSLRTASTLRAYCDCVRAYRESFSEEKNPILTRGALENFLKELYRPGKRMLALFSTGNEVLFTSETDGEDTARFIAEKALVYDASDAYLLVDREMEQKEEEALTEALRLIDIKLSIYRYGEEVT